MQKSILYGIIAAAVVAAGIGITFAAMSMNGNVSAPSVSQQSSDNEVRTFEHQLGETEITGTPKRVVVLEWTYAEHVMALGVEPVGVADIETMNDWVNLPGHTLSSSVTDVGLRWEPNLETIAQIEPDLIIGDSDNNGPIYDDLSAIAPTLLFNAYPLEHENVGGFERMREEFMIIADVLDRHDQGVAVLEKMEQKIEEGKAVVEANGMAGKEFALLMAGTFEGSTWMRIYTPNGQASQIIEMMGMENAWPVNHGQWGYSDAGLEDLTTVQDATFFYIAQDDDNLFETTFKDNPVWNNLDTVKEGRVYPIGGDTWTYGGPISAELIVDKVASAITSSARSISHAMGETEIEGTPERVVVLTTYFIEPFLAFDIEPVGLADLESTKSTWYPEISSWTETADIGASWEPNLEAIAQLEPDLIIGSHDLHGEMYEQLDDIAPTLLFHQRPAFYGEAGRNLSSLENMEQNFMAVSDALDRHDEGVVALEGMHAKFDDAAGRLEAAGATGKTVIVAMIWGFEDQSFIRVHAGDKALPVQVVEEIGLQNVISASTFEDEEIRQELEDWGELRVSLEGLAALDTPGAHLLILESTNFDAAMRSFEGNPVWNNLSFVKEGRVHTLGAVNAVGAGPIKLPELADRVVDALTSGGA